MHPSCRSLAPQAATALSRRLDPETITALCLAFARLGYFDVEFKSAVAATVADNLAVRGIGKQGFS